MLATAVIMDAPRKMVVQDVSVSPPEAGDVVVEVSHSGISTGTEKLFWSGDMPPFPGMGYPLIPGYEACGEVVEATAGSGFSVGDQVFVPGANCFGDIRGLFGGASSLLSTRADRVVRIDRQMGATGALLALAATARHAVAGIDKALPDLIVGHGVVGRLLARLTLAAGGPAPTVWETNPDRRAGADGYRVIDPEADTTQTYNCIFDASGNAAAVDLMISRLAHGGELVLAGFYADRVSFAFPPAFMREARLRVAAEWTQDDLVATRDLIDHGALNLDGLITHSSPANDAATAYATAFNDPTCLKMILDWGAKA